VPEEVMDGATVNLTGPENRTLISDATGFWGAVDLPVGTYTLTISQPGFRTLSRSFVVSGAAVAQPSTSLEIEPFQITSAVRDTGNNTVTLTWNSVPGRSYRVEKKQRFDQAWTTAQGGLEATGTSMSHMWSVPAGWNDEGYLRVARE
jgi:hypothetical protein